MVFLLPIIVIGGLFFPILGYLVVGMMAFFLTLSFFRGRYWCWNLCPRGAFLDIVVSKFSLYRPLPKIFTGKGLRWFLMIFVIFASFLVFRIIQKGGSLVMVGAIFVSICLVTTIVSIILGVTTKPRSWCAICPMGALQGKIGKIKKK